MNEIIIALLSAVTGGGLATVVQRVITMKSEKRKAAAEADSADARADGERIDAIDKALDTIVKLQAKVEEVEEHRSELRDECTTKGYYMCVHLGCPLRKPTLGRGKSFFKEHSKDDSFGADYTPIEDLYGRYKRTPKNDKE